MTEFYIGIMSGTSLDGVDAVLAMAGRGRFRLIMNHHLAYAPALHARLLALHEPGPDELHRAAILANELSALYATAVRRLLARAGVPGLSLQSGISFVGQPAEYARQKKDEYIAERYHQPSDEALPSFNYDGAAQQLRVIVRTAVAVANAPTQPLWNKTSEFREAGEKRLGR